MAESSPVPPADGAGSLGSRNRLPLVVLMVLALVYTMYFAAPVLIPVTLALLLNLVLSPVVNGLARTGLNRGLAAASILIALLVVLATTFYSLLAPATDWIASAPTRFAEMEGKLRFITEPMTRIKETMQNLEALANPEGYRDELEVKVRSPGILQALARGAPSLVTGVVISGVLLFFLLAGGDSALRKLVQLSPGFGNKRRLVECARVLRHEIAVYLATITFINFILGCSVTLILWLLGMPNAPLWGVLSGVMNFIPYLGAFISVGVVAVAAVMTFDSFGYALLMPAAVMLLSAVEGQLLTPAIAGRNLALSPVAAFVMLVFMGWLWGAMGALMAIPLLASIKLASERIAPLYPVSLMLVHPRSRRLEAARHSEGRRARGS